MSIYSWSTTAGTNASSDAAINWAEGQLPSTVNDSARAMMAALAAMVRDQGGYTATAGTSTAYTLALSQTMASAVPALVGFRAHTTNTGACTLNVDSLGANPLRAKTGVALAANDIISGCNYVVTWNSSSSEWLLINPASVNLPASCVLGTPASGTLTNCTGLPISTGVSGLGTGVATFLATPSSANLASAITNETGSGALVFATSPTLVTPVLGTPASCTLTNCTGLPTAGLVDAAVTPTKMSQPFTAMTAVTASGTSVNFSSIPSWANRITVVLSAVGFSVGDIMQLQIGPSGGVETSGYTAMSGNAVGGSGATSSTSGFTFSSVSNNTSQWSGTFVLTNPSGDIWVANNVLGSTGSTNVVLVVGTKSLSGTLTQLTVKGAGGQSFSGGTINVFYE